MLDEVGRMTYDTRHQYLAGRHLDRLPGSPFVLMSHVAGLEGIGLRFNRENQIDDVFQRQVVSIPGLPDWWDMIKPEPTVEEYRWRRKQPGPGQLGDWDLRDNFAQPSDSPNHCVEPVGRSINGAIPFAAETPSFPLLAGRGLDSARLFVSHIRGSRVPSALLCHVTPTLL